MYLPDLVLIEIFSNFNFEKLFNLRIVSKRWKFLIENLAKNQDCLYACSNYRCYNPKEQFNNRRIKYKEVIDQSFFENFCLDKNYFTNIKKLILSRFNLINLKNERSGFLIKFISENIEELHLVSQMTGEYGSVHYMDDISINNTLNFKNSKFLKLKILSIIQFRFRENFTLNSPILEKLCFGDLDFRKRLGIPILKSYDTIKTLECSNPTLYNRKFLNLEHLTCRCIDSNFDLSNYPKLKRLDLFPTIEEISIIKNLIKQKNQYRKFNLEILIFGLPISMVDRNAINLCSVFEIHRFSFCIRECLEPIKKNHLNLKTDHNPWQYSLNFKDSIFDTFQYFSKIDNFEVVADDLKETKNLINFIIKIGGVKSLQLARCKIDKRTKEYFEKIPFIKNLKLEDCEIERKLDFIPKIKKLQSIYFRTNYHTIQDFINNCNKDTCLIYSRLSLYNLAILTFSWEYNKVRIRNVDYRTFGETMKEGNYKIDEILPVLNTIKF